jgi:hypothetical protein
MIFFRTVDAKEYLRQIGRRGAAATNKKLTPEQRTESARKAAHARWEKEKAETQQKIAQLAAKVKKRAKTKAGK